MSLGEWQAVAGFTEQKISTNTVYGVRYAFDFVGALARKEVLPIQTSNDESLTYWIQQHPGKLVFLRLSIITVSDGPWNGKNIFSTVLPRDDLLTTFDHANIFYSSGEVVIISGI